MATIQEAGAQAALQQAEGDEPMQIDDTEHKKGKGKKGKKGEEEQEGAMQPVAPSAMPSTL